MDIKEKYNKGELIHFIETYLHTNDLNACVNNIAIDERSKAEQIDIIEHLVKKIFYLQTESRNTEKMKDIIEYAKNRCDGYIEDDQCDCEYCDGAFAACRKVLRLAGEDVSKYE